MTRRTSTSTRPARPNSWPAARSSPVAGDAGKLTPDALADGPGQLSSQGRPSRPAGGGQPHPTSPSSARPTRRRRDRGARRGRQGDAARACTWTARASPTPSPASACRRPTSPGGRASTSSPSAAPRTAASRPRRSSSSIRRTARDFGFTPPAGRARLLQELVHRGPVRRLPRPTATGWISPATPTRWARLAAAIEASAACAACVPAGRQRGLRDPRRRGRRDAEGGRRGLSSVVGGRACRPRRRRRRGRDAGAPGDELADDGRTRSTAFATCSSAADQTKKGAPCGAPFVRRAGCAVRSGGDLVDLLGLRPLPLPMAIVRGFMASGISRTRSTWRRPFSRSAPFTSTWSASWKRRSKAREPMPR